MTVPRIVRFGLSVVALTVSANLVAAEAGVDLQYSNKGDGRFVGEDLSDARLNYSMLSDANFSKANLSRARVEYCVASDARFDGATCRETQFNYSVLSDASFVGADCRGADFSGSTLSSADFSAADLRGSRFGSALLKGRFDANTIYDETTTFPPGFGPEERGLTFVSQRREQEAREGLESALEVLKLVAARFPETEAGKRAKELIEREADIEQLPHENEPFRPRIR